jgi:hypothetical protein
MNNLTSSFLFFGGGASKVSTHLTNWKRLGGFSVFLNSRRRKTKRGVVGGCGSFYKQATPNGVTTVSGVSP